MTVIGKVMLWIVVFGLPAAPPSPSPHARSEVSVQAYEDVAFVATFEEGGVSCRPSGVDARALGAARGRAGAAETIVVRSTGNITAELRLGPELVSRPHAIPGVVRGTEEWCALVEAPSPITIVLDVEFGPTVFGRPDVLGQARIQPLIGRGEYGQWRDALVANASNGRDLAMYSSLPPDAVPTDLGPTDTFVMPSTVLRVAGLLPAVTDPDAEAPQYGPPPAIGLNSNAPWDFDRDDGIDPGRLDFVGIVEHEIGHVLGFSTRCGSTESNPNAPLTFSAFDMFRFRPGIDLATFGTAPRAMTAGGEQGFFAGDQAITLSTARLDLMGGDGFSGDHWKDDSFTGRYLGVMDPQFQFADPSGIEPNDVHALAAMGYRVVGVPEDSTPFTGPIESELHGSAVAVRGVVFDVDGDVAFARISIRDAEGNALRDEQQAVDTAGARVHAFEATIPSLDDLPLATSVRLSFVDAAGLESASVASDFSRPDEGGPIVDSVEYRRGRLIIRGRGLRGETVEVEINSVVTTAGERKVTRRRVLITASTAELSLEKGPNRVRLVRDGLRSNLIVLLL